MQLLGGQGRQARVLVDAAGDVVQGPAGRHLRVGQVGQLGQAQRRKAGQQQLLTQCRRRFGRGEFLAGIFLVGRVAGVGPSLFRGLDLGLAVLPCEVVDAAGGWFAREGGVSAVVIVGVQPVREGVASFLF